MKSVNNELWNDINVEELEARDEYGWCFSCFWDCICYDCFCFDCFSIL